MEIKWRLDEYLKTLPADTIEKLKMFHVELLNKNSTGNLISTFTIPNSDFVHIYDCIVAANFIYAEAKGKLVYEFSSGNGIAGIVYAILFPNERVIIIEEDSRSASLIEKMTEECKISNIDIKNIKPEKLSENNPCVIINRGHSNLARVLLLGGKVFKTETLLYSLKSQDWFAELTSLPAQICSTWNTEMAKEYDLPESLGLRVILKV